MQEENPYTAPQTAPEPQVAIGNLPPVVLASRWERFGAAMLDLIILMVVLIPILFGIYVGFSANSVSEDHVKRILTGEQSIVVDLAYAVTVILVYLALNGYLLITSGQSIGKKILAIQIVDYNTRQLLTSSRVIGLRYILVTLISQIPFVGGLFGLIDVLFIFGAEKRCIHDLIANSIVIRK